MLSIILGALLVAPPSGDIPWGWYFPSGKVGTDQVGACLLKKGNLQDTTVRRIWAPVAQIQQCRRTNQPPLWPDDHSKARSMSTGPGFE